MTNTTAAAPLSAEQLASDANGMTRDSWLTKEYAHEAFTYVDGDLFWNERPLSHFPNAAYQARTNTRWAGKKAGSVFNGYVSISMKTMLKAHRIIFLMHHGYLPAEIDHIDGNSMNNRIENLRAVDRFQNMRNTTTQRNTKTGVKGVGVKGSKFCAYIRKEKKQVHLGMFDRIEDAVAARKQAEKEQYGEYANDR